MCESRRSLGVIGEREQEQNLLREFIEDTTAPEVYFSLWPCRTSATDRVPGSLVDRFCALVWPAHEVARPVTIVFGHLLTNRVIMRSGGMRTRQTRGRCTGC